MIQKTFLQPPSFSEAWQIGEPDAVFSMDQEYTLEADLTDHYLYFQTPDKLQRRSDGSRP